MTRRADVRSTPSGTVVAPRGAVVQLGAVLFALLVLSLSAGIACRNHEAGVGVGGQSGDEGRRPTSPWLGTGGVASEPARP